MAKRYPKWFTGLCRTIYDNVADGIMEVDVMPERSTTEKINEVGRIVANDRAGRMEKLEVEKLEVEKGGPMYSDHSWSEYHKAIDPKDPCHPATNAAYAYAAHVTDRIEDARSYGKAYKAAIALYWVEEARSLIAALENVA